MNHEAEDLNLDCELEWDEHLHKSGYLKELCEKYGIGLPKGETIFSGCIVFTVYNEQGTKVAYYGYRMRDYKPVYHKSFNPELYLYNYHNIDLTKPVYLTTSLHFWLVIVRDIDPNAIAVFDLPYLSARQLNLLREIPEITFFGPKDEMDPIINQVNKFLDDYLHIFKKV